MDERRARRRRSALRDPSFVDRMELPEDAAGRVSVFAVDDRTADDDLLLPSVALPRRDGPLTAALDHPWAPAVIAAALVVVLILGLLTLRR